jgi:hypothetical protein
MWTDGWTDMTKLTVAFFKFFFAKAPKTQQLLIQYTNSSQTQQFHYIIIFKATCFDRSNVSTFIVHSVITKAYNRWYSQYTTGFEARTTQCAVVAVRGNFLSMIILK